MSHCVFTSISDSLLSPPPADDGEYEMDDDDEYADEVSSADIEAEEQEDSDLFKAAEVWQNFLDYVELVQAPWADEVEDTDDYRMKRAVTLYNAGVPACLSTLAHVTAHLRSPEMMRPRVAMVIGAKVANQRTVPAKANAKKLGAPHNGGVRCSLADPCAR